jgi:hypothetical protein
MKLEGQSAEVPSPSQDRCALVGRRRCLANEKKILYFRGASLIHTYIASSSVCLKDLVQQLLFDNVLLVGRKTNLYGLRMVEAHG